MICPLALPSGHRSLLMDLAPGCGTHGPSPVNPRCDFQTRPVLLLYAPRGTLSPQYVFLFWV